MNTGITNFVFLWLLQSFFILPHIACAPLIDLQDLHQDFVLETKQIEIPGYPGAFNPAITRWKNDILLTFRIRDPETGNTSQNGFVWLNKDLQMISKPKPIEILFNHTPEYSKMQDPRILTVGNEHYIVFNNQTGMGPNKEIRRMFIAKLFYHSNRLYTDNPEPLLHFDSPQEQLQEKNWVPFAYKKELYLAYSLDPHIILQPVPGTQSCKTIASTDKDISWDWGDLRGGTPALLDGDQYLGFFHSSKEMATVNSKGKSITHYFIGAYTFKKTPPFDITAISPEPIVGENFYYGKQYQTWKPLLVVFPCGFICDENFVWVAYGRQDHEVCIVKLDKKGLLKSLKPVSPILENDK